MMELLEKLCSLHGVSGNETEVSAFIREFAKPYADKIDEDSMGNLIIFKKGKKKREKTLLLAAHMDEVGMIIRDITEDGYLKFDLVGGIDRRVCIGKRVLVGDKKIPGLIGLRAIHLTSVAERNTTPKLSELYIDIGCEKKSSAKKLVSPGDYVSFSSGFVRLSENKIKARALDDRFGCAVLLTLLSEELMYDTYFAFTVQEEVGVRGARCVAFSVKPDISLVVESTTACDIPDCDGAQEVCRQGCGTVIGYMDGGAIYDKALFALLRDIAEKKRIKWQMKERVAGGTDARSIQLTGSGARVTSLSIPTRYIHSPSSVADIRDMEATLMLAREFVNTKEESFDA